MPTPNRGIESRSLTSEPHYVMKDNQSKPLILVVEDVHEIRYGMEKLLTTDGYLVSLARDEQDAIDNVQWRPPNLILVSLPGLPNEVILAAARIRESAPGGTRVPVVIFCVEGINEGEEVAIGENVHLTRPDNFNQLRGLLARVLGDLNSSTSSSAAGPTEEKTLL